MSISPNRARSPWAASRRPWARLTFTVRGETITALAQPHRFYLLQRVQDVFTNLSDEKQAEIRALLEACGMKSLLAAALSRRIVRSENLEVWQ